MITGRDGGEWCERSRTAPRLCAFWIAALAGVEAFFDEADAGSLRLGMAVTVRLTTASATRWKGTIRTSRAGSGRVAVGRGTYSPRLKSRAGSCP